MYKHTKVTQQGSEIVVICNLETEPQPCYEVLTDPEGDEAHDEWMDNCETFRFEDGELNKLMISLVGIKGSDYVFTKSEINYIIKDGIQCDQIVIRCSSCNHKLGDPLKSNNCCPDGDNYYRAYFKDDEGESKLYTFTDMKNLFEFAVRLPSIYRSRRLEKEKGIFKNYIKSLKK